MCFNNDYLLGEISLDLIGWGLLEWIKLVWDGLWSCLIGNVNNWCLFWGWVEIGVLGGLRGVGIGFLLEIFVCWAVWVVVRGLIGDLIFGISVRW